jgi:subtilase family serine protease
MKKGSYPGRIVISTVALLALLVIIGSTFYFQIGSAHAVEPQYKINRIKIPQTYKQVGTARADVKPEEVTFSCQDNTAVPRCYGPRQMQQAYDVTRVHQAGYKGQGRTIVIVDAFQSPTIEHDVQLFSQIFGLPDANLKIVAPFGLTPFDPNNPDHIGWAGEITLDVEWSHAIAPLANIVLVLAKSNNDADIINALKYVVDKNLGDVISMSFGEAEACMDPALVKQQHQIFKQATKKGITLLASSGDAGAAQPNCEGTDYVLSASTPASDPLVTSVGGTFLNADAKTGQYISEEVWNDDFGSSGGGYSTLYRRPFYQYGFNSKNQRGVPDVAYNGAVNSGVLTVWSSSGLGEDLVFIFGGTSAGSPQWAGIIALVDQFIHGRVGFINPLLYLVLTRLNYSRYFHDITVGNNSFGGIDGYKATVGWDATTGLGSPIVGNTLFGPPGAKGKSKPIWNVQSTTSVADSL